jgi:phosphoglucosamine mutase
LKANLLGSITVSTVAEKALSGQGRLLIRKSGTEPLVRVMAESENSGLMKQAVDEVLAAIETVVA